MILQEPRLRHGQQQLSPGTREHAAPWGRTAPQTVRVVLFPEQLDYKPLVVQCPLLSSVTAFCDNIGERECRCRCTRGRASQHPFLKTLCTVQGSCCSGTGPPGVQLPVRPFSLQEGIRPTGAAGPPPTQRSSRRGGVAGHTLSLPPCGLLLVRGKRFKTGHG